MQWLLDSLSCQPSQSEEERNPLAFAAFTFPLFIYIAPKQICSQGKRGCLLVYMLSFPTHSTALNNSSLENITV